MLPGATPSALAAKSAETCTVCLPFMPVKALALPELTSSPRAVPPFSTSRHQSTGADGHLDDVNTPATVVPSSNAASSTSVRFLYLIPASAVAKRTPAICGSSGKVLGARGETLWAMAVRLGGGRNPHARCSRRAQDEVDRSIRARRVRP